MFDRYFSRTKQAQDTRCRYLLKTSSNILSVAYYSGRYTPKKVKDGVLERLLPTDDLNHYEMNVSNWDTISNKIQPTISTYWGSFQQI